MRIICWTAGDASRQRSGAALGVGRRGDMTREQWLADIVEDAMRDLPEGAGFQYVLGLILGKCWVELGARRTDEIMSELVRREETWPR